MEVEPLGEVFSGLPPGVRVNVPSLNVYDNHWGGPTLDAANHRGPSALALTLARNPVHGVARLSLALPESGVARVEVFDVSGARMATLLEGWQPAGTRTLEWRAPEGRAGAYFVRVASAGRHTSMRLVVLP